MLNKLSITGLLFCLLAGVSLAGDSVLIDNFNCKNLKAPVYWWTFDCAPSASKGVLSFDKLSRNFYGGGCGTYIAKEGVDYSKYNAIKLDIIGTGNDSGTLKIELVDDDNGNWSCEQDKKGKVLKDDVFVYEQRVDWKGLKTITIPFADFVDDNDTVGNDEFDIGKTGQSGGLLQIQLICLSNSPIASIKFAVDNIMIVKEKP